MATAITTDLGGLPQFDCKGEVSNIGTKWKRWIRAFELFVTGKGVTDADQKKALLLHCAGMNVQDIYYTLPEIAGEDDAYVKTKTALETYFSPQVNLPYERHVFRNLAQSESETIEQFITRLKQQAEYCEFGATLDDQIRDQVIDKCMSSHLRRKLLEKGRTLTLDQLRQIATSMETADKQARNIEGMKELKINKVAGRRERQVVKKPDHGYMHNGKQAAKPEKLCFRCGNKGHFGKDLTCPARDKLCNKCGREGHFAICCKTRVPQARKQGKGKPRVRHVEEQSGEDEFAFSVSGFADNNNQITVKVGGVNIKMLIDSGASCNIIDKQMWTNLKDKKIKCKSEKTVRKIYAYGNPKPLPILGVFYADVITRKRQKENVDFIVIDGKGEALLGRKTATELGLLKIYTDDSVNTVYLTTTDLEGAYPEVFDGVGTLIDHQIKIHIDPGVKPVVQGLRRIPFSLRNKVEEKLNELERMEIIEKVEGPSTWISPVVIAPKPSGEIRLCVDMRQANTAVIRERFPIPTIDEVLNDMNGAKYFSKLDLKWGYHQLKLDEESRDITTFITHKGLYRYKRLMFGISSAPELYQHTIQNILSGIEGVNNISDDIIIHGKTGKEHDDRLHEVMNRLKSRGLTVNKDKLELKMNQLTFMGHVLSKDGIAPTKSRVEAIINARHPETSSEVRSFLGLVNYCGKFIPNLATVAEPLRKLTRNNVQFKWGIDQEKSFNALKRRLSESKSLAYFDKNAKTRIIADASPIGLGAVLAQEQGGISRVICYASRTLSDVERRYSQTEKEALALVWACERFHLYLYGIKFELVTDHKPLEVIYSRKSKPSARIERWVLRLQPYDFNVVYRPGVNNIADTLSRLVKPVSTEPVDDSESYIRLVARENAPRALDIKLIERESAKDEELTEVRYAIKTGKWEKTTCAPIYRAIETELTTVGKLVLRGTRIVIPGTLRKQVLKLAHEGHPGIVSMKQRLRTNVWWPGLEKDCEKVCKTCHGCQIVAAPAKPEPMKRTELPSAPWQHLAMDLLGPFPTGESLFVVVDYYSRYYEIEIMRKTTSDKIIDALEKMFLTHGLPYSITSDNGPQFISEEFATYVEENAIIHHRITPLWPQANGEVERQNRSLSKRIRIAQSESKDWKKELRKYLVAYRTTPHTTTGVSPSQMMFKRKIRTKLPEIYGADIETDTDVRDRDAEEKGKGKLYADKRRNATESTVKVGDDVLLKQQKRDKFTTTFESEPYKVVDKRGNNITIESSTGVQYERNSSHVKPYLSSCEDDNAGEKIVENETVIEASTDAIQETEKPSRPTREIRLPAKFKDFVMK
ncbi:hypothetical protein FSP39_010680 [Pinctada imbricata]|uniref:RNA-directed DNA polymerase n=1 Tax=Pinctada imbricata TaxID=66713 RepID=A0AA88YDZ4_PINIB|nr:hypothetical protein FSP39_010680 [Pinctada imbricata]